MKKKYLLTILIMLVAIIFGLFVGYYILFYMNLPPKMQLVGDSEFLINHLLEKEKLETFISTSKIEEIENGETTDLYKKGAFHFFCGRKWKPVKKGI